MAELAGPRTSASVYLRISEDPTGLRAGVDRQRTEILEMLDRRGWTVRDEYLDNDISATRARMRPAFEALLASEPQAIAVWHTDRLVRGFKDLERVIDLEVAVVAVQVSDLDLATPSGRMLARMLTAVASFEGEHKSARQRSYARQRVTETGAPWWPRRPFGFTQDRQKDGTVVVGHHEAEAEAVLAAHEAVLLGRPLARIADDWNTAGLLTNTGRRWTGMTARVVMMHPRNAALMTYLGEEVGTSGAWEPIVSERMHRAVVRALSGDERKAGGGGARTGLLSGLATCGVCGSPVRVAWRGTKGAAGSYRVYACRAGSHVSRRADWVDRIVEAVVVARLQRPDAAMLLLGDRAPDQDALRVEAEDLQSEMAELMRLSGPSAPVGQRIRVTEAAAMMQPLYDRMDEIAALLGPASGASMLLPFVGAEDVRQVWDAADAGRRRAVIGALYSVTLRRTGRGRAPTLEDVVLTPVGQPVAEL